MVDSKLQMHVSQYQRTSNGYTPMFWGFSIPLGHVYGNTVRPNRSGKTQDGGHLTSNANSSAYRNVACYISTSVAQNSYKFQLIVGSQNIGALVAIAVVGIRKITCPEVEICIWSLETAILGFSTWVWSHSIPTNPNGMMEYFHFKGHVIHISFLDLPVPENRLL